MYPALCWNIPFVSCFIWEVLHDRPVSFSEKIFCFLVIIWFFHVPCTVHVLQIQFMPNVAISASSCNLQDCCPVYLVLSWVLPNIVSSWAIFVLNLEEDLACTCLLVHWLYMGQPYFVTCSPYCYQVIFFRPYRHKVRGICGLRWSIKTYELSWFGYSVTFRIMSVVKKLILLRMWQQLGFHYTHASVNQSSQKLASILFL